MGLPGGVAAAAIDLASWGKVSAENVSREV